MLTPELFTALCFIQVNVGDGWTAEATLSKTVENSTFRAEPKDLVLAGVKAWLIAIDPGCKLRAA